MTRLKRPTRTLGTKWVHLRLSPQEERTLKLAAAKDRRPLSTWIRYVALDEAKRQVV